MDRGQPDQCQRTGDDRAPPGLLGNVQQAQQGRNDQGGSPDKVWNGEDRVPATQFGEVQIERLQLHAQDARIPEPLHEKAGSRAEHHEENRDPACRRVHKPRAKAVDGEDESDGAADLAQVIDRDQGQMEQCGQVTEHQVEAEEEDACVRLARIGVRPEPGAVRALPYLRQVGGRVVRDEEEACEVVSRGRPEVGEEVGEKGGGGNNAGKGQGEHRDARRQAHRLRVGPLQRERSSHGLNSKSRMVPRRRAFATRSTRGSVVCALRNPGAPKAGPAAQRDRTLKTSNTTTVAVVGPGGHPARPRTVKMPQSTGSSTTRWCGQVTAERSGISGRKASSRSWGSAPQVCQAHQASASIETRAMTTTGLPSTSHGSVYGFTVVSRRMKPLTDWLA